MRRGWFAFQCVSTIGLEGTYPLQKYNEVLGLVFRMLQMLSQVFKACDSQRGDGFQSFQTDDT